jgi:hypothetical protein
LSNDRTIVGSAFKAEVGWEEVRFWIALEAKTIVVKSSKIRAATMLENGYTKIDVGSGKDLILPTSAAESAELARSLNALISEHAAVGLRRSREVYRRFTPIGLLTRLSMFSGGAVLTGFGFWMMIFSENIRLLIPGILAFAIGVAIMLTAVTHRGERRDLRHGY